MFYSASHEEWYNTYMRREEVPPVRIFLGEDTKRSREALAGALDKAKAEDPNAFVSRFDDTSFDSLLLHEALRNQSIFGGRNIVVIDGILDHVGGEEFYRTLRGLRGTVNRLFIRETFAGKEMRAVFKEIGIIEEFLLPETPPKKNAFALADAVARHDKRSAWVEFIRLKRDGAVMEELHGMVFWAIKTLYLCATQTKEETVKAGMKAFTYCSYQPRTKKFLVSELAGRLGQLKEMYHQAHEGDADLGIFLEQFLLKL